LLQEITPKEIFSYDIINMDNVWASYDGKGYVLKDVSLSIKGGINYIIIGPSGSGKTTLLKMMNGLVKPNKGRVRVFSADVGSNGHFKALMPKIGYIPQNLGLVKNMSVMDNVLMGSLHRVSNFRSVLKKFPDEEMESAEEATKLVGLDDKPDRKVYMLSGGEKRRVAIARAFVQKPSLLLADEIVSELDFVKSREIMDMIHSVKQRMGITMVMVHHDIEIALEYADMIAVMKDGVKLAEFKPNELDRASVTKLFNGHEA
jgi:phosphonate transport system ATP-binding protein